LLDSLLQESIKKLRVKFHRQASALLTCVTEIKWSVISATDQGILPASVQTLRREAAAVNVVADGTVACVVTIAMGVQFATNVTHQAILRANVLKMMAVGEEE